MDDQPEHQKDKMEKKFYLNSFFTTTKAVKTKSGKGLTVAGYANTITKDRIGDVIIPAAWYKGVEEYKKNPILLYQHNLFP